MAPGSPPPGLPAAQHSALESEAAARVIISTRERCLRDFVTRAARSARPQRVYATRIEDDAELQAKAGRAIGAMFAVGQRKRQLVGKFTTAWGRRQAAKSEEEAVRQRELNAQQRADADRQAQVAFLDNERRGRRWINVGQATGRLRIAEPLAAKIYSVMEGLIRYETERDEIKGWRGIWRAWLASRPHELRRRGTDRAAGEARRIAVCRHCEQPSVGYCSHTGMPHAVGDVVVHRRAFCPNTGKRLYGAKALLPQALWPAPPAAPPAAASPRATQSPGGLSPAAVTRRGRRGGDGGRDAERAQREEALQRQLRHRLPASTYASETLYAAEQPPLPMLEGKAGELLMDACIALLRKDVVKHFCEAMSVHGVELRADTPSLHPHLAAPDAAQQLEKKGSARSARSGVGESPRLPTTSAVSGHIELSPGMSDAPMLVVS